MHGSKEILVFYFIFLNGILHTVSIKTLQFGLGLKYTTFWNNTTYICSKME